MNPTTIVLVIGLLKEAALLYMDIMNKQEITKDDLQAKTPEELLAELGDENINKLLGITPKTE